MAPGGTLSGRVFFQRSHIKQRQGHSLLVRRMTPEETRRPDRLSSCSRKKPWGLNGSTGFRDGRCARIQGVSKFLTTMHAACGQCYQSCSAPNPKTEAQNGSAFIRGFQLSYKARRIACGIRILDLRAPAAVPPGPRRASLERALELAINLRAGRVFADTWNLEQFSSCSSCFDNRRQRLQAMNIQQETLARVNCPICQRP